MGSWLRHLKPTEEEVRELALGETDPSAFRRFQPINRGPWFAVSAILVVLLVSIPASIIRLFKSGLHRDAGTD